MPKIHHEIELNDMKSALIMADKVYYGARTCWWTTDKKSLYKAPGTNIPCDPRSGPLFMTDNALQFIQEALNNPSYYGRHGLRAFLLAYNGCVVADNGDPTCFETWEEYNELIDRTLTELNGEKV